MDMTFKYGEPISVELSDILKEFTTSQDIADASTKTGISISTLHYLKRRTNTVTENNEIGITELMRIAIKNADGNIQRARFCKNKLTKILDNK